MNIYKFKLAVSGVNTSLQLSSNSKILHVATQMGIPHVWVLTDPNEPQIEVIINCYGTGEKVTDYSKYIGTLEVGAGYIFHYFENTL